MKATTIAAAISLAICSSTAFAEEKKDEAKEEKTLTQILETKSAFDGFLPIYQDEKDGSSLLVIDPSQLDKPFLYFASTVDGPVAAGHFRGGFRDYRLIEMRRDFDRIEFVAKTPRYYFDPENAISKAADANISEAVLVSAKIEHEDDGKIAIKLDDVVTNENLHRIAPMPADDPKVDKTRYKLGKLSGDKTKIASIDNFAQNTHVVVDYVFENDTPKVSGGNEITDPRFTTISLQHAFIELPESDFQPRRDDPRIGYFGQQFDDLTSDQTFIGRDVINRWHLKKKDPNAAVSDPVEPIVWWIENTTPVEWRDTIRDATLAWNSAFEKAGFSNAIVVKVQPDDADWKADDVRYNVLRWTSSPTPPFGGYGPSVANPLTGQIIAADIMLEYTFMKGRWITGKMFTDGVNALENPLPEGLSEEAVNYCSLGHQLNAGLMFGQYASLAQGMDDINKDKLLKQSMYYLILHEVGHTLGLNHNMKATQLHGPKEAHDASITQGILAGSVMDYPSVNYAPEGMEQGDFYSEKPGPYDDWAIEYGYSTALADPNAEEERLSSILARSTEPALAFGNDADDMRAPGRHLDPRVNIFDMSSDAIAYAQDRFGLIKSTATKLKDKTLTEGRSHNDLVVGVNVVFGEFARQASVVSRYVGGVYVDRSYVGQEGYQQPFTPVAKADQERAMKTLRDFVFAPNAISEMEPLFAYLQRQRRGFDHFGNNEDPKLHDMLLGAQKNVLNHLLHPAVTLRLSDTALYGNEYSVEALLADLTAAIFDADIKRDVNSYRRNLQTEYVERLIAISGLEAASKYDNFAKAAAVYELNRVKKLVDSSRGDQATKVHRFYLNDRISRAFHKSAS
ncbi:zinc-dependent metalloprotease [Alteromonas facilis]|uniref:zinc-dependent metalloprotease n=1 Tax=Alteromonas facilis TaxID=2048004 RepID=UPI000C292EFE|nr:zinc-dependent metalloprotease [Alteromonas facilis]